MDFFLQIWCLTGTQVKNELKTHDFLCRKFSRLSSKIWSGWLALGGGVIFWGPLWGKSKNSRNFYKLINLRIFGIIDCRTAPEPGSVCWRNKSVSGGVCQPLISPGVFFRLKTPVVAPPWSPKMKWAFPDS